jgi:hypothetical protein
MAKRFLTYFNVPLPPFKEENFGANSTTIRFVIKGNIPSKKNNQQAVTIRKHARSWANNLQKSGKQPTWADVQKAIGMTSSKMRGNVKYNDFVKKFKPVIQEQMKEWSSRLSEKGLIFPLAKSTMTLKLYFKGRYITDTVNKQQTIQDLLVECGVISNDDYKTLNPIVSKSGCFFEEITEDIAFISLTTNLVK